MTRVIETILEIRIDWGDMDLYGHINNVAFMKYIQTGRIAFWESLGLASKPLPESEGAGEETGFGFVLASTHCDFKANLFYPGTVKIKTELEKVGNTSITLIHTLWNDAGEIAAHGKDVLVTFDYIDRKKIAVPGWVRERFG